jgi:hypothetical protein
MVWMSCGIRLVGIGGMIHLIVGAHTAAQSGGAGGAGALNRGPVSLRFVIVTGPKTHVCFFYQSALTSF